METTLTATEVRQQYADVELPLPWKQIQTIVINDKPWFDLAAFARSNAIFDLDSDGNSLMFHVKPGELVCDDNNGRLPVNEEYDLSVSYSSGQWRITIKLTDQAMRHSRTDDVLVLIPPIAVDGIDDFYLRCRFRKLDSTQFIESLLAIDLGNTRSCALLCEDIHNITRHDGIQIQKVPIFSYTDHTVHDIGVFDSYVSLARGDSVSFARVGREAIPVANTLRGLRGSGDFYLSSPKRYFWDGDPNINGWKALANGNTAIALSQLPTARKLASLMRVDDVDDLPRAGILAAMLIEIIEQAEDFLNTSSAYADNAQPKVVSNVCVTFPAGWNTQEHARYKQVMQEAVDAYQAFRCNGYPPINLDVSCDEATAVLLCYVYGEIEKYSGRADIWLDAVGRNLMDGAGSRVRIAVIDVGGGTSDLAIINVQNKQSANGLNLQIDTLYKDGTNKAGDLLLQGVTEGMLVEKLARATISPRAPEAIRNRYIDQFAHRLNSLSTTDGVKQLTRRFWFPLAINFINAATDGKNEVALPDTFRILVEVLKSHPEWSGNSIESSLDSISIADDDRKLLDQHILKTFRDTAKLFGAAIYAFDADLVILSGKTTEIPQVQQVFKKYCYLPEKRFIPMWKYLIGDWCPVADGGIISDSKLTTAIGALIYNVLNNNFPVHAMEATISTRNAYCLNEGSSVWGVLFNGDFSVADAIFKPGKDESWVVMVGGRAKLLARRRFAVDATEIAISCELRLKPFWKLSREWQQHYERYHARQRNEFDISFENGVDLDPDCYLIIRLNPKPLRMPQVAVTIGIDESDDTKNAIVIKKVDGKYEDGTRVTKDDLKLRLLPREQNLCGDINVKLRLFTDVNGNGNVVIEEVNGKYDNSMPVDRDDLEIRIRTSGNELFWLDSGRI